MVYNNARAYVPFLGRYLQADPLGLASGSLNNYVYVGNNPVNLVDPLGLSAIDHVRNFANGFDDTTTFGLSNFGADKGYSLSYNIGSFAAMTAGIFYGATEARALNTLRQMFTPRAVANSVEADARVICAGIKTPYGVANQGMSSAAMSARSEVESGASLYRIGTMGKSQASEGQFWALEHPMSAGYTSKYGIPAGNVSKADFIEIGKLPKGQSFVTRSAPAVGENVGGGVEVVTNANAVKLKSFSTM